MKRINKPQFQTYDGKVFNDVQDAVEHERRMYEEWLDDIEVHGCDSLEFDFRYLMRWVEKQSIEENYEGCAYEVMKQLLTDYFHASNKT